MVESARFGVGTPEVVGCWFDLLAVGCDGEAAFWLLIAWACRALVLDQVAGAVV